MKERGISEADVEYCLGNYSICYRDGRGNPIYGAQLPSGKTIKVVIAQDSVDPRVVITVADIAQLEGDDATQARP